MKTIEAGTYSPASALYGSERGSVMNDKPNLDDNKTDFAVAVAKGTLGAIPGVGGIAAEIVGTLIPRQRLDRIAEFLEILGEKVAGVERDMLEQKMKSEEFIDLFHYRTEKVC